MINNGMINHHPLRSSHHVADPRFGMVNTLPFMAGHHMGHIRGHPFHALPAQPYTMVPVATAVHDPTYISKNGEVEHVVKGIHAETAIKNIHGVTKREAEPMEIKVDGVHARTALDTMPTMARMPCGPAGCVAHNIAPTMTHSMLHPFHAGHPMVRTISPNTHLGSILSHSGIHGINAGIHGIPRIASSMFYSQ